jgi:hypothetical protein
MGRWRKRILLCNRADRGLCIITSCDSGLTSIWCPVTRELEKLSQREKAQPQLKLVHTSAKARWPQISIVKSL